MSDIGQTKLSDAMNYVDPDFITEYENLSAYVSAKKAARRRRINIATRVAASLAIIFTGVFLIMKDIDNGLIGQPKKSEEIIHKQGNTNSSDKQGLAVDVREPIFEGMDSMSRKCVVEDLNVEASGDEITVSVASVDSDSLSLDFSFDEEKFIWYTGNSVDIYTVSDDGDTVLFHSNVADLALYRLVGDKNGKCDFCYSWGDQCGSLPAGRYLIATAISDGYVTYKVRTTIRVNKE